MTALRSEAYRATGVVTHTMSARQIIEAEVQQPHASRAELEKTVLHLRRMLLAPNLSQGHETVLSKRLLQALTSLRALPAEEMPVPRNKLRRHKNAETDWWF